MHTITPEQALALVKKHWQLEGSAKELPSYADRNFKIDTAQGKYVFKIANPNWSYDDLDIENAALLHLEKTCPDLALPNVKLALDNRHIIPLLTAQGEACHMRLLSFVEGEVYAHVATCSDIDQTKLQRSLGVAIAKIGRGLEDFQHPSASRYVDWSISNLPDLKNEIESIEDANLRVIVARHTAYYIEHEHAWQQSLPMLVIHNDANDFNTIVASDAANPSAHVNAIIDFGDMCRSFRIVDLAIAMTYALQHVADDDAVLACAMEILSGYQKTYPLNQAELEVLFHFIMARLSQSILMATKASRRQPDNEYIMVSQKEVRRLINQLDSMSYEKIQQRFLSVLQNPQQ
jgi:Ser/Thr protein kinase RdoA (MazF antagonist)